MNKAHYKYLGETEYGKLFYNRADAIEHLRFLLEYDFPELDPAKTTIAEALDKCFEKIDNGK